MKEDYFDSELKKGKTFVLLIRHGERIYIEGNKAAGLSLPGPGLSSKGKAQAKFISEELSKLSKIDLLFSSSMTRSKETAEIISKKLGKKIIVLDDFQELNSKYEESLFKRFFCRDYWRMKRVSIKFNELLVNNPSKILTFILHGRLIRDLFGNKLKISFEKRKDIVMNNCHITFLKFDKKKLETVYCVNSKYFDWN